METLQMEILTPPVMEPLEDKLSVGNCDPWMPRIRTRFGNTSRSAGTRPRVISCSDQKKLIHRSYLVD